MSSEERRHDIDTRRLFEKIEAQERSIADLSLKLELFIATRDLEFKVLKSEQEKIDKNQEKILNHLDKFKAWLFAGSIVIVILAGLGKAAFWVHDNAPALIDIFRK